MARKRRKPPKHLKARDSHRHMPARLNHRLEHKRKRQLGAAGEAYSKPEYELRHHGEHSHYDSVAETADNTKLFYDKLLPLAKTSHDKNKRFLRAGVTWLFALPVILFIIRNLTDGNKIAFLIVWIIGMFIIASALILIAYQDEILQRNLDELQEYVPEVEDNQLGKLQIVSAEDLRMLSPNGMDAIIQEAMAERAEFEKRMAAIRNVRTEFAHEDTEPTGQQIDDLPSDDKGGAENG